MSVNNCPLLHIELLEPIQPAPHPGELETFPQITLDTNSIIHVDRCSRKPRLNVVRSGARLSRFRTQPISFSEIKEVDEARKPNDDGKDAADASSATTMLTKAGYDEVVESASATRN